jgi:hypothetical protein
MLIGMLLAGPNLWQAGPIGFIALAWGVWGYLRFGRNQSLVPDPRAARMVGVVGLVLGLAAILLSLFVLFVRKG